MAAHRYGSLVETKLITDRFTFFLPNNFLLLNPTLTRRRSSTPLFMTTHLENTERTRQGL